MALNRKFLNALGIEAEKQDEIISQHIGTLNEVKDERDQLKLEVEKLKKEAEKYASTEKELEEAKKTIADLESSEGDGFKKKYEDLQAEFDTYKKEIETKAATEKKTNAYKQLLKEANIPEKRFDAVIKLSGDEIDKIEFEEDGKIKDSDTIKKGIEENWSDYIVTSGKQGASTPTPPSNDGNGGGGKSRAAMIAEKYHENLYGKIKED